MSTPTPAPSANSGASSTVERRWACEPFTVVSGAGRPAAARQRRHRRDHPHRAADRAAPGGAGALALEALRYRRRRQRGPRHAS